MKKLTKQILKEMVLEELEVLSEQSEEELSGQSVVPDDPPKSQPKPDKKKKGAPKKELPAVDCQADGYPAGWVSTGFACVPPTDPAAVAASSGQSGEETPLGSGFERAVEFQASGEELPMDVKAKAKETLKKFNAAMATVRKAYKAGDWAEVQKLMPELIRLKALVKKYRTDGTLKKTRLRRKYKFPSAKQFKKKGGKAFKDYDEFYKAVDGNDEAKKLLSRNGRLPKGGKDKRWGRSHWAAWKELVGQGKKAAEKPADADKPTRQSRTKARYLYPKRRGPRARETWLSVDTETLKRLASGRKASGVQGRWRRQTVGGSVFVPYDSKILKQVQAYQKKNNMRVTETP